MTGLVTITADALPTAQAAGIEPGIAAGGNTAQAAIVHPAGTAEREDLTVFFSIGVVVDVLLVAAFLVWAIGQWRRTRK